MALAIRLAGPADVPVVRSIVADAYQRYEPRLGRPAPPVTADYDAAVRRGETWLASDGDQPVGILVLVPKPDHLLLQNIAVSPSRQTRGIGTQLLDFTDAKACELGLPEVRLFTHLVMTENQAYYPRHGYLETHRAEENGFSRIFYTKTLS